MNENFVGAKIVESISTGKRILRSRRTSRVSTSDKYLLLGTAAFAALPGAPAPDYIIVDNFFDTVEDTIWYGMAQGYGQFSHSWSMIFHSTVSTRLS